MNAKNCHVWLPVSAFMDIHCLPRGLAGQASPWWPAGDPKHILERAIVHGWVEDSCVSMMPSGPRGLEVPTRAATVQFCSSPGASFCHDGRVAARDCIFVR